MITPLYYYTYRGLSNCFSVYFQFSELHHIEIWRDNAGFNSDWFLATVMIVNQETKIKTVFPVFRWIQPNYRYKFFPFDTSLPQVDLARIGKRHLIIYCMAKLYQLFLLLLLFQTRSQVEYKSSVLFSQIRKKDRKKKKDADNTLNEYVFVHSYSASI